MKACNYCRKPKRDIVLSVGAIVCCSDCHSSTTWVALAKLYSVPFVPLLDRPVYRRVFGGSRVLASEACPLPLAISVLSGNEPDWSGSKWYEYQKLRNPSSLEGQIAQSRNTIEAILGWNTEDTWLPVRYLVCPQSGVLELFDGLHRVSVAVARGQSVVRGVRCVRR